jgi:L-ascorbate metabolism protein UlaG (beta-lactamase superfamily)
MIITYYGKQYFKIQQGDTTIALNPLSKENTLKLKATKFAADVSLCTMRHPDYNGFDNNAYNGKEPFKIYGPGSYEINGNLFVGYGEQAKRKDSDFINTVYFFTIEGISFCFLGDLAHENIDQKTKEHIESVDVIFVPIGGNETLDPVQASKIVKNFSPKVIIPMDYGKDRDKGMLEAFLKEMSSQTKAIEKYVFKKKDLETLTGHVVVLEAQ